MARTLAPFMLGLLLLAAAVHAMEGIPPPGPVDGATDIPADGGAAGTDTPADGGAAGTDTPADGGAAGTAIPADGGAAGTDTPADGGPIALPSQTIDNNQPTVTATQVPTLTSTEPQPQTISGAVTPRALPTSQPAVPPTATQGSSGTGSATGSSSTGSATGSASTGSATGSASASVGRPASVRPLPRPIRGVFPGAFPFGFYGPFYNYGFNYGFGRNFRPLPFRFPQQPFFPNQFPNTVFNGVGGASFVGDDAPQAIPTAVPQQGISANALSNPGGNSGGQTVTQFARLITTGTQG